MIETDKLTRLIDRCEDVAFNETFAPEPYEPTYEPIYVTALQREMIVTALREYRLNHHDRVRDADHGHNGRLLFRLWGCNSWQSFTIDEAETELGLTGGQR